MEVKPQAKLRLLGVDIYNISFNSVKPFQAGTAITTAITPKVFYPNEAPSQFYIFIDVAINCPEYFELKVSGVGMFNIEDNVEAKERKSFVNVNAPAIVFPYIRSFISTLSSNMGRSTGSLSLSPQFFMGELPVLSEANFLNSVIKK